ncbi:multiple epidermal growth factor-like domains protein 10, partial [Saccostrea cucullata]
CKERGMFGKNCSLRCPEACQENRCHILDGTCLGCKPGWVGDHCDKACPIKQYGLDCNKTFAGYCKDNNTYDHATGQCKDGCAYGWTGAHCDERCLDGAYGSNCIYNCTGNCLNEIPCNKISGKCDTGCKPGYTNDKCDK